MIFLFLFFSSCDLIGMRALDYLQNGHISHNIHTHTHTYIYVCICIYLCAYMQNLKQ